MKNLILTIAFFFFNEIYSQTESYCGYLPPHQASTTNPDSIFYDRYDNTYDRYESTQAISFNNCMSGSGYFQIDFTSNAMNSLSSDQREIICKVFNDISNIIDRRTNNTDCGDEIPKKPIIIRVSTNYSSTSNIIGDGSASYIPMSKSCRGTPSSSHFHAGEPYTIINGGKDHEDLPWHGLLNINTFYNSLFYVNYEGVSPPIGTNQIDFRSLVFHEAIHILDWTSGMRATGINPQGMRLFDNYLYLFDQSNNVLKKILTGVNGTNCSNKNCWKLESGITNLSQIITNNCNGTQTDNIGLGLPFLAYVNGANCYPAGVNASNYFCHLSTNCNGLTDNYVMQSCLPRGARAFQLTETELKMLCKLGYKINPIVYDCDGCPIVAYFETYKNTSTYSCCFKPQYTCVGNKVEIPLEDFICNDFSISKENIEFFNEQSGVTIFKNLTTNKLEVTSQNQQDALVYYTIKGCEGDCKMLNSYFEIGFGPCLNCNAGNKCLNLSCSNGFEEFDKELTKETGIFVYTLGDNFWVFEGANFNSPDLCIEPGGNKYLKMGVNYENGQPIPEGLAIRLSHPIEVGCTLNVTFKASSSTTGGQLNLMGSQYAPCKSDDKPVKQGCNPTNCSGYTYSPICLTTQPLQINNLSSNNGTACDDLNGVLYTVSFPNTGPNAFPINYIVFYPESSTGNLLFINFDDVIIKENCSVTNITDNAVNCLEHNFIANIGLTSNTYQWEFDDPGSGSNNYSNSNPANHVFSQEGIYEITLTVTDEYCNETQFTKEVICNCDFLEYCNCALPVSSNCEVKLHNTSISTAFPNSSQASLDGCCILIKGKLIIDKDFSIGGNSLLKMEPGAEIEVSPGVYFNIGDSWLFGCYKMWKGITCLNGSKLALVNCHVLDAEYGVHAFGGSTLNLQNNYFFRSYVGVFIENGAVNNSIPMINNRFYTNGNFLPPYLGQFNIPGAFGYCGVLVKNGVFSIGSSSAVNYFYDLYNGVIGQNSDVTVTKADIRNLITIRSRLSLPRKFSNPDGDGIFGNNCFLTAMANTISQTNGSITDYQGKSMIAHDNILSNTVSGIFCAYPKLECYMDKNQITSYHLYGIGVVSPQTKINLMITRTNPFISSTSSSLANGSTAIFLENVTAINLAQIQENIMTLDPYSNGIVLKSCQKIGLQANTGSYSSISERNGVELSTSPFNIVYNNSIVDYQSISAQGNAFYFMDSKSNRVCCNNSSGTRSGFHFSNASLMRNLFRTNSILDHQFGLHCDNGAQIDDQSNCGNAWHGYYSQVGAAHFGSDFDIRRSRHFVYNCNFPIWPPTIFPLQTCNFANFSNPDWFQRIGDVPDPVCISDQSCVKPFNNIIRVIRGKGGDGGLGGFAEDDGSFNATDTLLATEGFIGNNSFETRALWEMSYDLLYRLKLNPNIYEENSIMSDFVSDNQSSNLGKFVRLDLRLDTLISQLEIQENQLQTHLYIIDSARSEIQIIDSIFLNHSLSEEDSLVLVNERMSWSILQLNSKLQIDTILGNYEILKEYGLDALELFLSSITPTNIVESNRKEVLTIYFNSSLRGQDTLTTDQFNIISMIANSCSRSGGRSVIIARQLYLLNEYQEFNDDTICQYEPLPIVLGSETFKLPEEKLKVYPNPSNGNFIIELKNGNFSAGSELFIYDLKGREVFFKSFDKECVKVEITKNDLGLLEGVFLCKVISKSNVLYSPKIILNK